VTTTLMVMANETRKGLLITWTYKFNWLIGAFMLSFIFIGIGFFIGDGELQQERLAPALLGYLIWFYALEAISNMSWALREETNTGTLEQMYMSPVSPGILMIGRTLSTLVSTSIMVAVAGITLMLLLNITLPLRIEAVPVFILTMAGLYGFGYIVGGLTLIFKHTESFANLIQNALLFLNGAFLPVNRLPPALEVVALLLPSTQGIIVIRKVILEKASLVAVWNDGSLQYLLVHSVVFFLGGLMIFRYCEHVAKRRGTLGQY
jgi:ABC-2 type transport system permease protein